MRYLLIAIALLFTACGDCKNVTEAVCDAYRAGGAIRESSVSNQRTPQGALVQGFRAVSDSQLRTIDGGLTGARSDADSVSVTTFLSDDGTARNGVLSSTYVEILVYP